MPQVLNLFGERLCLALGSIPSVSIMMRVKSIKIEPRGKEILRGTYDFHIYRMKAATYFLYPYPSSSRNLIESM